MRGVAAVALWLIPSVVSAQADVRPSNPSAAVRLEARIRAADSNSDGVISVEEWARVALSGHARFDPFDANLNGVLDEGEVKAGARAIAATYAGICEVTAASAHMSVQACVESFVSR